MKQLILSFAVLTAIGNVAYPQEKPNKAAKATINKVKKEVILEEGKDPICKMHVEKDAKNTSTYQGKKVNFCSIVCKEMFDKNPEKYAVKAAVKR
ncbi:YHS domain-containing protein [Arcicella rosea]|uniref:YHS domain-containing protein n=1 Tax=Arcicella rosea TaxID=502909 RepID=A0A841ELF4_9BACT|nr:YHS domain-containing protein [Arcicella rosea]MBB6001608.1 YHS domain-containing protein [Arcicella rosea]